MRWLLPLCLVASPLSAQWVDTRPPGCLATAFQVASQAKRVLLWWPGKVQRIYAPWYAAWYRDPEGVLMLVDVPSRLYVSGTRTGPIRVVEVADTTSALVDTASVRVQITFDGTASPCPEA